jgi:hypothetical protein
MKKNKNKEKGIKEFKTEIQSINSGKKIKNSKIISLETELLH